MVEEEENKKKPVAPNISINKQILTVTQKKWI